MKVSALPKVFTATQILPDTVEALHLSLLMKGVDCFSQAAFIGEGEFAGTMLPCAFGIVTSTGDQRALEGDWVLEDEWGNYSVVPQILFDMLYEETHD